MIQKVQPFEQIPTISKNKTKKRIGQFRNLKKSVPESKLLEPLTDRKIEEIHLNSIRKDSGET